MHEGTRQLARTLDFDQALDALEGAVQLRVASGASRWLFVHAGVVAWRDRAIVIPGPSGAGKTRLVAALIAAGASYYSDEFALFDAHGRVHPYPRPLAVRNDAGTGKTRSRAESFGAAVGDEPLPVGLVAAVSYVPGARWRARSISPAEAVLALLANTVRARTQPDVALKILGRVATGAVAWRGTRGAADEAVQRLLGQPSRLTDRATGGWLDPSTRRTIYGLSGIQEGR